MLRIILLALSFLALSCSKDKPTPLSPASKTVAALTNPAPPTNLRFDNPTSTSCRVRWDASEGAADYDLNYKKVPNGRWQLEPHKGTRLYNTINELEPNTTYRWAVRAENSQGASAWVEGPRFTTQTEDDTSVATLAKPAPPINLRFDTPTSSECTVRWDASEGAADYDLNYKKVPNGRWQLEPHKGTRLYNTISELEPNTTYRWAVRAENSQGASAWVEGPRFTTQTEADGQNTSPVPKIETDVDFNIEIVFLDDFDPDKKAWIEEIASQWEMFFYDMDDYVFDDEIELPIYAGLNVHFEKGEVIDDIRIYVDKFSKGSNYTTVWDEHPYGLGDVVLFRPDGDVPVIGTVLMNDNRMEKQRKKNNESSHFMEFLWRETFHHEMGHALGIGPSPAWVRNVYWQDNANAWFIGPNAVREYRLMAPDDDSPGVPLSESSIQKPRIAPHWESHGPMQWGFFDTYFLQDNGLPNITRTALGAFHDIGWNVNYEMGLPKIPDDILPCWLLGDIGNFHLCPREE